MSPLIGKNPALPGVPRHIAQGLARGTARSCENPFGFRRFGGSVFVRTPVRQRTSRGEHGQPALMMTARKTRGNYPRAPRNPFFRRTSRISSLSSRRAETASRGGKGPRFPGACQPFLPGKVPVARGDQSLPVRISLRPGKALHMRSGGNRTVSKPNFLTHARSNRPFRRRSKAFVR